jgi:hypothetical protein
MKRNDWRLCPDECSDIQDGVAGGKSAPDFAPPNLGYLLA